MIVRIERAKPEDADAIQLRPTDLHEASLWAPGLSPAEALKASIGSSVVAYTASDAAGPVAVFGYSLHESRVHPWLMCSDRAAAYGRVILRIARPWLRSLHQALPGALVCNYVHRDNLQAKRLLQALGFHVVPAPAAATFEFFHLP